MPTLQERSGDLALLVDRLVAQLADGGGRQISLSNASRNLLEGQHWPGQVAQLNEVLGRAVAFSPGREIQTELLEEILKEGQLSVDQIRSESNKRERELLISTMQETGGNIKRTAEILGKSRPAIYRSLKKYWL